MAPFFALKEANETNYWLELLLKTNYIDEAKYQELNNACSQIRVMPIKSINTAI
jgi:four helix bundle protein